MPAHAVLNIPGSFNGFFITHADQQQVAQVLNDLTRKLARIAAAIKRFVNGHHPQRGIIFKQRIDQFKNQLIGGGSQHGLRQFQVNTPAGRCQLIQQGDGVAHRPGGLARDQQQRFLIRLDPFVTADLAQGLRCFQHRDAPEFMPLAARQHGRRDLMHLGRRQDKNGVRRRLFQGF